MLARLTLHVANLASLVLPQTRMFGTRASLYRAAGVGLANGAKVNGTARIHDPNVHIGEGTWLGAGCQVIATNAAPGRIGARCDIAPEVMFVVGSHEIGPHDRRGGPGASRPITVGDGCWIGARAVFLAGSQIGNGCVVAAGAVVRGTFPDDVVIGGVPARILKELPVDAPRPAPAER